MSLMSVEKHSAKILISLLMLHVLLKRIGCTVPSLILGSKQRKALYLLKMIQMIMRVITTGYDWSSVQSQHTSRFMSGSWQSEVLDQLLWILNKNDQPCESG